MVESAIAEIGIVTIRSGDAIANARAEYDGLATSLQSSVGNSDDLVNAEELFRDAQIKDIEQAIRAMGTITLTSQGAIDNARVTYEKYSPGIQTATSNYDDLVSAEENIITLNTEHVKGLIEAIGTVKLESTKAISAARSAYDKYSGIVRENISNYSVLVEAEKQFTLLRVGNANILINAIGTVTLDSNESINKAIAVYEDLTEAERTKVTNPDALQAASKLLNELQAAEEKRLEELQAAERDNQYNAALSRMRSETDKVQGLTWYSSHSEPEYINERSFVLPYIGKPDTGVPFLRMKMNYTGDDWIFFSDIIFLIDGVRHDKSYRYSDIERDNDYGVIWEFVDIELSRAEIDMIRKIANSSETIVRFQGDAYHYDLTVSSKDKAAIKDILTVYDRWADNDGENA